MSNEIFNDVCPGFPFVRGTFFKNTIMESYAGQEQAFNHTTHDRKRWRVNFSALTDTESEEVVDFFEARKGSFETFLFDDASYHFVERLTIGTADNIEDTFQLIDSGGFSRKNIQATPVDVKIWVNGGLQGSGYTIGYVDNGECVFDTPPVTGLIEAEFYFYIRVRFTSEGIDPSHARWNDLVISQLPFREVIV